MSDDASTGVAYDTHDQPRFDRVVDALRLAEHDDRDEAVERAKPPRPRLPRRFVRSTTVPVEPMS